MERSKSLPPIEAIPFWFIRAEEELQVRQARPTDLPAVLDDWFDEPSALDTKGRGTMGMA